MAGQQIRAKLQISESDSFDTAAFIGGCRVAISAAAEISWDYKGEWRIRGTFNDDGRILEARGPSRNEAVLALFRAFLVPGLIDDEAPRRDGSSAR